MSCPKSDGELDVRWGFCVNCLKTDHFNHTLSLAFDRALNILMLRMIGAKRGEQKLVSVSGHRAWPIKPLPAEEWWLMDSRPGVRDTRGSMTMFAMLSMFGECHQGLLEMKMSVYTEHSWLL